MNTLCKNCGHEKEKHIKSEGYCTVLIRAELAYCHCPSFQHEVKSEHCSGCYGDDPTDEGRTHQMGTIEHPDDKKSACHVASTLLALGKDPREDVDDPGYRPEKEQFDDILNAIVRDFTSMAYPKIKSDLRSRIQDYAAEREKTARQKYETQAEHGKESGNQSTVYLAGKIEGARSERERIKKEIEKFYDGADAKLVRKIILLSLI